MKYLVIKQNGKACELWHGDTLIASGGRVAMKKRAKEIHLQTQDPVWNWKENNTRVEVQYAEPHGPR